MNEHQVAMGESTCASKLWAAPTTAGNILHCEALKGVLNSQVVELNSGILIQPPPSLTHEP
jgi:hypothetical protein